MTTSFGDIPRMVISHERENHIFNCHVYAMFCSSLHLACENIRPSSPVCSYARRGTAVFAGYTSHLKVKMMSSLLHNAHIILIFTVKDTTLFT